MVRTKVKRLVILTREGREHHYVVNALCAAFDIDCIVVDRRQQRPSVARAMRRGLWHFLNKAARRIFLTVARDDKARDRALRGLFGEEGEAFCAPDKIISVDGINSSATVALLK